MIPTIKESVYGGDPKDACVKAFDLQEQHHHERKCGMCPKCCPDQESNDDNRALARKLLDPIVPRPVRRTRSAEPKPKYHPSNAKRKADELSRAREEEKERWNKHHVEKEAARVVRLEIDGDHKNLARHREKREDAVEVPRGLP